MAPSSALPIGSAAIVTELKPIKVDPGIPGSGLLNTVLALLSPVQHQVGTWTSEDLSDEILECDVAGFLIVYVAQRSSHSSFTHSRTALAFGILGTFCYHYMIFLFVVSCILHYFLHTSFFSMWISFGRSSAIDIPNRKMTILSPLPGSLAGRVAVAGSFEWQDQ